MAGVTRRLEEEAAAMAEEQLKARLVEETAAQLHKVQRAARTKRKLEKV
jgi:hypothetical protein